MTLKRSSPTLAQKLGLLLLGALLLAGVCWWLLRPKTFTLLSHYPLDGPPNQFTTLDTRFTPAGLLIEQLQPSPYSNQYGAPRSYILLDWDGKQRWKVASPRFEPLARLPEFVIRRVKDPTTGRVTLQQQKNYDLFQYSIWPAISPDGRILAEAKLSPRSITLRRWRDGRADGLLQIPLARLLPQRDGSKWRTLNVQVTDSGRIWLNDMYGTLWCIDGTQVASGKYTDPFVGLTLHALSPDGQTLVYSTGNSEIYESSTVQVTGSRIVVTPHTRQDFHALLARQGDGEGGLLYDGYGGWFTSDLKGVAQNGWTFCSDNNHTAICQRVGMQCRILVPRQHIRWLFSLNAGEFQVTSSHDGRYALVLAADVGMPADNAAALSSALGVRNRLGTPYFLLYERPGHLRALLRLHPQDYTLPAWKTAFLPNAPRSFLLYEQGIPYRIESWSLSPDGHRLGVEVTKQSPVSGLSSGERSLFLYKW